MVYEKIIYLNLEELEKIEEILAALHGTCREFEPDEVIATYSVEFANEFEADLEIVNGDPPYIRGTLYRPVEDEEEIVLFEVDEKLMPGKLEGEHFFEYEGQVYKVLVKRSYFEEPGCS